MAQAILIEAPEAGTALPAALEAVAEAGLKSPIVISNYRPSGASSEQVRYMSGNLADSLKQAVAGLGGKQVIFLNAGYVNNGKELKKFLTESSEKKVAFAGLKAADKGRLESPKPQVKTLIQMLSSNPSWPTAALACPANLMEKLGDIAPESAVEVLVELMIAAIGAGYKLEKAGEIKVTKESLESHPLQLTAPEGARALKLAVESCNIEELFPNHPWNKFQEESLAACYHTLAALFIRLGDLESAESALTQSQALEDSPRALTLRGLLSMKRGDYLGASAHLIAALQQYEARLKDSAPHYVTFAPKNFKKINEMLLSGLGELNNKNNQSAASKFLDAIFLYDAFFHEHGVAKISALQ